MKDFCSTATAAVIAISIAISGCASSGEKKALSSTERAKLLIELANAHILENDPVGALQNLVQAEKNDDSLPELYHTRALAYLAKKDFPAALDSAKQAVSMKKDYSDAQITLGKLLMDQGRYEEAIPHLQIAANDSLSREAFKASTNLGILYYKRGDMQASRKHLDKAIADSPVNACVAYYYRGHVGLREQKFNESITDYEKATQRACASFTDAHLALGIALTRDRQYDRARKKYLEIQNRFPRTAAADKALQNLRELP